MLIEKSVFKRSLVNWCSSKALLPATNLLKNCNKITKLFYLESTRRFHLCLTIICKQFIINSGYYK